MQALFRGFRSLSMHAHRHVKRPESRAGEVLVQLLDARLMADRGILVGRAGRRLGRILAALTVDLVEMLGLGVVRLEVVVADRPGR